MAKEASQNSFATVLAEAMRAKGISIDKLARKTGISERFIRLIIEERFDRLPAAPYLHGYIVKIAEVFEMDGENLWATYFKNNRHLRSSGTSDRLPKNRFAVPQINRKVLVFAIIIIAVASYFVVRSAVSFDVTRELKLQGFDKDIIVSQSKTYKLKGSINTAFKLTINDMPIYPASNGDFEKTIELEPGFNTIIFGVKGPLNKKKELVKQIYYRKENGENGGEKPVLRTDEERSIYPAETTSTPVSKETVTAPPGRN